MTKFFTYSTALLAGLTLLGSTQHADAQQFSKRKQYTSIGISLNAMNYFGDLNPATNFASFHPGDTRPNIGLNITHRFFPRVSGRFSLAYGAIHANDNTNADANDQNARFRNARNMNFRNRITEASAEIVVDLIENRNNYLKRPDFVPYLFLGVAGFHHNPEGMRADGTYTPLQPLMTENVSYSLWQVSIPFGGGVRYRVNRNMDVSLEIGLRKTFTGYLDDVSGNYVTPTNTAPDALYFAHGITNQGTAKIPGLDNVGNKRGQGKDDWYTVTGISLNYILNPKIKNPKFR
ncbi:DUF6089 family protein [Hymenobacter baengnokdamensis]|uniref:DUF6089 family protein n=1 Tax=Hymenobacter baengnokdamensis TaxID=2615203 RepID=UPI0012449F1E|nr:DUF6089 family protein [Hymenobacter baengnokdamensis]